MVAQQKHSRTVLTKCYCTPPFCIMRTFPDSDRSKVILMTASAGILSGDCHQIDIRLTDQAKLTVEGQGYTKLFQSTGEPSRQSITASVDSGCELFYQPPMTTPFSGCDFRQNAEVSISSDSHLLWWDMLACGRSHRGEAFAMKHYQSRLTVKVDGLTVFADHTLLGVDWLDPRSMAFFDGYSHMGTLYLYAPSAGQEILSAIRGLAFGGRFGASQCRKGLVVRALAHSGEELEQLFRVIAELVRQSKDFTAYEVKQ